MYSIYIKRNGRWIRAHRPKPNIFGSRKQAEKAIEIWNEGYFIHHEWKIDKLLIY